MNSVSCFMGSTFFFDTHIFCLFIFYRDCLFSSDCTSKRPLDRARSQNPKGPHHRRKSHYHPVRGFLRVMMWKRVNSLLRRNNDSWQCLHQVLIQLLAGNGKHGHRKASRYFIMYLCDVLYPHVSFAWSSLLFWRHRHANRPCVNTLWKFTICCVTPTCCKHPPMFKHSSCSFTRMQPIMFAIY